MHSEANHRRNAVVAEVSDPSLEALDGVGPSRAEKLREAGFTSVETALHANVEELVAIDGIGEATATDIHASASALLDASESTSSTPRTESLSATNVASTSPYVAEPYRAVTVGLEPQPSEMDGGTTPSRSTTTEQSAPSRDPDQQKSGDASPDDGSLLSEDNQSLSGISDSPPSGISDGLTLQLVGDLLAREADETGRIGRERIRASDFDVNVTVTLTHESRFEKTIEDILGEGIVAPEDIDAIRELETSLLEWAAETPTNAAQLVVDPTTALSNIEPDVASAVTSAVDARPRDTGLSPVGIRSMQVNVDTLEGY